MNSNFDFSQLFGSLSTNFGSALPKVLGALAVLIIGLFIARIVRGAIAKVLKRSGVDSRLGSSSVSISKIVSKLVYYVIVIFVLMAVLNMMGITGALAPLQDMLAKVTGYIPNIIGAGIIGFVGYTIANIAKEAVGAISGTIESYTDKYDLGAELNLTGIIKQLVFLFVFIPLLLVALDTLNMEMISDPAKNMLNQLMSAIPNIIAAGIILFVFYIVGKFVVGIVGDLLKSMNVDSYADSLGMGSMTANSSLSTMITKGLQAFIMFFGLLTAVDRLGFTQLSDILNSILGMAGSIIFGGIILLIGNKISTLVSDYFKKSDSPAMASIARFATLGLFLAMGLKYMGLADDIVNLAFGLTLGAVAVAFALSFGLGGREAAGRQMGKFLDKF